ncbi:MAG: Pre-mRNA-splicing factor 18, partial [Paramarteilia canceri]
IPLEAASSQRKLIENKEEKNLNTNDAKKIKLEQEDLQIPSRSEVIKRLRSRNQPITLFGENEFGSWQRLRKLEISTPDNVDTQKNDLKDAIKKAENKMLLQALSSKYSNQGKSLNQSNKILSQDEIDIQMNEFVNNASNLGNFIIYSNNF